MPKLLRGVRPPDPRQTFPNYKAAERAAEKYGADLRRRGFHVEVTPDPCGGIVGVYSVMVDPGGDEDAQTEDVITFGLPQGTGK